MIVLLTMWALAYGPLDWTFPAWLWIFASIHTLWSYTEKVILGHQLKCKAQGPGRATR